jgi:uncharacterized protein (TIGR02118 family)
MLKVMVLLAKRSGLSIAEFRRHWLEVHAPLVHALPGLRRYVQDHVVSNLDIPAAVPLGVEIDGIAELWFDDEAAVQRAFASEADRFWRPTPGYSSVGAHSWS